jgi:hypothetical protein
VEKVRACAEAHAKSVVTAQLTDLDSVRLRLQMTAHELSIQAGEAPATRLAFMRRSEALRTLPLLQYALAQRFEVTMTRLYSFLCRRAVFLTR